MSKRPFVSIDFHPEDYRRSKYPRVPIKVTQDTPQSSFTMPMPAKSTYKSFKKYKSSKKSKGNGLATKAYVKRLIGANEEHKVNVKSQSGGATMSVSGASQPLYFALFPSIPQDDGVNNRIGNKVKLTKVLMGINPVLNAASVTATTDVPLILQMYLVELRNAAGAATLTQADTDAMFYTNTGTLAGYASGSIHQPSFPVNDEYFKLHKKFEPIKLGWADYTDADNGLYSNNDFCAQFSHTYDITKYYKKILHFGSDAGNGPTNASLFLIVGCQKVDLGVATTNWDAPLIGCNLIYYFTDA